MFDCMYVSDVKSNFLVCVCMYSPSPHMNLIFKVSAQMADRSTLFKSCIQQLKHRNSTLALARQACGRIREEQHELQVVC